MNEPKSLPTPNIIDRNPHKHVDFLRLDRLRSEFLACDRALRPLPSEPRLHVEILRSLQALFHITNELRRSIEILDKRTKTK